MFLRGNIEVKNLCMVPDCFPGSPLVAFELNCGNLGTQCFSHLGKVGKLKVMGLQPGIFIGWHC